MIDDSRRRFLTHFAALGFGSTLLPGVLWGQMQQSAAQQITPEMLKAAVALAGLSLDEEEQKTMLDSVNRNLVSYEEVRNLHIPNDVSPPFHFSPLTPGMKVSATIHPLRDGTHGGQFMAIRMPDGSVKGNANAAPSANAGLDGSFSKQV